MKFVRALAIVFGVLLLVFVVGRLLQPAQQSVPDEAKTGSPVTEGVRPPTAAGANPDPLSVSVPEARFHAPVPGAPASPLAKLLSASTETGRTEPEILADGRARRVRTVETSAFKHRHLRVVETFRPLPDGSGFHPEAEISVMVADQVLVAPVRPLADDEMAQVAAAVGGRVFQSIPLTDHFLVELPSAGIDSLPEARRVLESHPLVRTPEPNYLVFASLVPNDPEFSQLYAMRNTGQAINGKTGTNDADTDLVEAWDMTTGSRSVMVAVLDSGVDYTHPDLVANIAINTGEIPGNGIDDDNNGFVDDVYGWDFSEGDADPSDYNGHGTHCAGTVAAVGNDGAGVTGAAWKASILPVRFLDSNGSGSIADAISAVQYSLLRGARISSNSWGGSETGTVLGEIIRDGGTGPVGQVVIAAAGNGNTSGLNYPAAYAYSNILSVAASDNKDAPASFTNWSSVSVDVAAPGVDIYSTLPGGEHGYLSGTSMATPLVSGIAALIHSIEPDLSAADTLAWIRNSVDPVAAFHPSTGSKPIATGGRVNAYKALYNNLNRPLLNVTSTVITDGGNANGVPNPGETVTIAVTLKNVGRITATSVNATLSLDPSHADVTLLQGSANPGDFASLAEKTTVFRFTTQAGTPTPLTLDFALTTTDGSGNTRNFAVPVTIYRQHTVTGTVRSIDGTPIAGAKITCNDPYRSETLTGADGSYSLELVDGTSALTASKTGHITSAPRNVSLPPGATGVDFILGSRGLTSSASEVAAVAAPGARTTVPVTLSNSGTLPTRFTLRAMEYSVETNETAGPDKPVFNWIDITSTGTLISTPEIYYRDYDVFNSGPFPIGMSFPFYENRFSSFRLNGTGWVSFTSASRSLDNRVGELPDVNRPENMIAFAWAGYVDGSVTYPQENYPADARRTYYKQVDPQTFVITNRRHALIEGDLLTSQIVLKSDGTIYLQYGAFEKWDGSTTGSYFGTPRVYVAGMQDQFGRRGHTPVYGPERTLPSNGRVIRFRPSIGAPWLKTSVSSASVDAAGQLQLKLEFDATNLAAGTYSTSVVLDTDDPAQPVITLPVTFTVGGSAPALAWVQPASDALLTAGTPVLLDVQSTGSGLGTVRFYSGDTLLGEGTASNDRHTFLWSAPSSGAHVLRAEAVLGDGSVVSTPLRNVSVGSGFLVGIDALDWGASAPIHSRNRAMVTRYGVTPLDFSQATVTSYGSTADYGRVSVDDDGRTLRIGGVSYKKIPLNYTVTANTVIEFDFLGNNQASPETKANFFGIGFDNDNTLSANRVFNLWGSRALSGSITTYRTYREETSDRLKSRWQHYRIPVGQFFTGTQNFLTFVQFVGGTADDNAYRHDQDAAFRNVVIYEDPHAPSPYSFTWNFTDSPLATFTGEEVFHAFSKPGIQQASVSAALGSQTATASRTLSVLGAETFGVRVNFQPAEAPVPYGYVPDSGAVYGDRGNGFTYGWVGAANTSAADGDYPSMAKSQERDTFIRQSTSQTWEIAVPNGRYGILLAVGLSSTSGSTITINNLLQINGQTLVDKNFNQNEWYDAYKIIDVTNGKLTLTSGRNTAAINFIELNRLDSFTAAAPVAAFHASPLAGTSPLDVQFDASASFHNSGTITTYAWDFGDGTTASGLTANHTFTGNSARRVTLTVTDSAGLSSITETTISVTGAPPEASSIAVSPAETLVAINSQTAFSASVLDQYGAPMNPQPAITWSVSGGGSINASGLLTAGSQTGGPHTVTATSGSLSGDATFDVVSAIATSIVVTPSTATVQPTGTWQFSATVLDQNGAAMNPQPTVTWSATGSGTVNTTGLFTAGGSTGPATVTATVTAVSGSAAVTVANTAPTVTITSPSQSALAMPDGDNSLVLTATATDAEVTPTVTWSQVSGPAGGTATFANANTANTSVTFSADGAYILRITASDGLLTATDEVTIHVGTSGGLGPVSAYLGTNFLSGVTSGTADSLRFSGDNADKTIAFTGGGSNTASPMWTVANATKVDFKQIDSVTHNGFTWGQSSDPIRYGSVFTTGTDFGYVIGSSNSNIRYSGTTATEPMVQFGAGAPASGAFNFVFEIKGGEPLGNLTVKYKAGTASTSGAWHTTNTAANNGNYNVSVHPLDGSGNAGTGFTFYATNQALGAGGGIAVTATDQGANSLSAGTYLLRILFFDKTRAERYSIDDVSIEGSTGLPAGPQVNPGPAPAATVGEAATLSGTASANATWSVVSGPGTATFANASSASTTVTFSTAGTHVLRLSATDGSATVFEDLTVTVNGEDFASWVANEPGTNGQAAPADDPDADGLPNLVEYALGGAAGSPDSNLLPAVDTSADHLTLTFTPMVTQGLRYIIEASDDLLDWSDQTDVTSLLTPGQPYTHTDNATLTTRRFLRLKVIEEP